MDAPALRDLLASVKEGAVSVEAALSTLADLPFADLGHTNFEHHRALRNGFPEVIYCAGKSPAQIRDIVAHLASRSALVLGTRCSPEQYAAAKTVCPALEYHETARIIRAVYEPLPAKNGCVAIVSAGTSDMSVSEEAAIILETLGVRVERFYDVGVAGIHRLLSRIDEIRKASAVIAIAGMEGALPSVIGGLVACPVIAVPTSVGYGVGAGGVTALHAMLSSCASGITVVNIDNGFGAACGAFRIISAAGVSQD